MMLYTTVCDGCGEKHTVSGDDLPPSTGFGPDLVPLPGGWTEVTLATTAPSLPSIADTTKEKVRKAAKKSELPEEATSVMEAYLDGMKPMFQTGPRETRQVFTYCPVCTPRIALPRLDMQQKG